LYHFLTHPSNESVLFKSFYPEKFTVLDLLQEFYLPTAEKKTDLQDIRMAGREIEDTSTAVDRNVHSY
jgi:poly-beta-hydroxyalkanoate depolymerase